MRLRGTKVSGVSVLLILGTLCFVAILVAATITWSSVSTDPKTPQEVALVITSDAWSDAQFYETGKSYPVSVTATYDFHGEPGITYYLTVVASESGTNDIQTGDFTITATIQGITHSIKETGSGIWSSENEITLSSSTASSSIVITIAPTSGAMDLTDVSFTISAVDSDPAP